MKNPIDQLIESVRNIRLTDEASERMRARLIAHMREYPALNKPLPSPYRRFLGVFSPFASLLRVPAAAAFTLILLVAVGGATTFAAADALPGNPLYPLKVRVMEPARGLLAVSPEAQAEFRVSLVKTRLHEVEQLAVKEKLTPLNSARSKAGFDTSLQESQDLIDKLSRENFEAAAQAEISLVEALGKHKDGLNKISVNASSTVAAEARLFANHIRTKTAVARKAASATFGISAKEPVRAARQDARVHTTLFIEATSTTESVTMMVVAATTTTEASTTETTLHNSEESLRQEVERAFRNVSDEIEL